MEQLLPPDPGSAVVLVAYRPAWPDLYAQQERRIRDALGPVALQVLHVGSTSVPGLTAKDVIDVVLVVPDAADEAAYADALVAAGYRLSHREPEWFEHRLLKGWGPRVNLHVFGIGCSEVERMVAFRDHLRSHEDDCGRYEATKRELAARRWDRVQDYADAKSDVVADILGRALT